ncbi:hypothetical protein EMCRGX_G022651 [Ephydatia muelleri]
MAVRTGYEIAVGCLNTPECPKYITYYSIAHLADEGKSFSNHAKENHSVYISARDQQAIKATCFKEESPCQSSDHPLPPLDFLETFDGFKCVSCNYYTRVQRHAESHAQMWHRNNRVVSCKVRHWPPRLLPARDIDILAFSRTLLAAEAYQPKKQQPPTKRQPSRVTPETDKRLLHYDRMVPGTRSGSTIDKAAALRLPGPEDPDHNMKWASQSLTKLAFFSINIGLLGQSPLIAFDEKLTRLADNLFGNATTNRRTVFDLMQYLLAQKTSTGEQDSAIIPLFLHFSCLIPNGCLMPPEEARTGSKYEETERMVELDNFNLFSFVCRIHSLAAKVVCCSHCLPMVNRKGEAILVRGCYLTVSHLRSAYKTALNSCNGLLEELLLGFDQPLRLEEVYDNFADLSPGFRFMPNQDPSKIEAICSALLKHVLHTVAIADY